MSKLMVAYLKGAMYGDIEPDMTKCTGKGCLMKMQCKRFTIKGHATSQKFMMPPDEKEDCEYFYPNTGGETQ